MSSRLVHATLAGLAFAVVAAALGRMVTGRLPVPARAPALLVPALLTGACLASGDRRFTRRLGLGVPTLPIAVVVVFLALATCHRLAGAWMPTGLESMVYQAAGLASAGLGIVYGWRHRVPGAHALAAVIACWVTAFAVVGWSLPVADGPTLRRNVAEAALALAAGALAGWLVGYGLGARREVGVSSQ